jgi:hypothetical protein
VRCLAVIDRDPDLPLVPGLVVDAPDFAACIHDQLHVGGHTPAPVCPRRRMFRRGLSTSSSPTLA